MNSAVGFLLMISVSIGTATAEKGEIMEEAESQSFGYGYGSKVDTKTGTSYVSVHGFGVDNDHADLQYHDSGYGHADSYGGASGYHKGYEYDNGRNNPDIDDEDGDYGKYHDDNQ